MTSTFFGLEIAVRGLRGQQTGLDVTGQNVANANTPGYSRQTAELATTPPYTVPSFNRVTGAAQMGTGATVANITRARDQFLDMRFRTESSISQQNQVAQGALQQLEGVFQDPSSSGMSTLFSTFFNSWQDLANNPSDSAARAVVVGRATDLAAGFNQAARQITAVQQSLNDQVDARVNDANSDASQIASLNLQIALGEFAGGHANDLRDKRDALVDHLSGLVQVTTTENANGSIDVFIGAHSLVQGSTVDDLKTTNAGPGGMWDVRFTSDNALATLNTGELRGLEDVRDQNIPSYLTSLNQIAGNLITAVNGLHVTGYGQDGLNGRPFFAGTDAATIAVDPTIAGNPSLVGVAGAANQSGDNTIALAIAQLQNTASPTPQAAYNALITTLGRDSQAMTARVGSQSGVVSLLQQRRESLSGVSLDEEAINTVRYQRAYEAAARVITTVDQMLDKLINNTGLVGR